MVVKLTLVDHYTLRCVMSFEGRGEEITSFNDLNMFMCRSFSLGQLLMQYYGRVPRLEKWLRKGLCGCDLVVLHHDSVRL